MSYLWMGLGGALGSMARGWLAMAVARITGPQFPWGTILINIVGSFVIGFFGTLTAQDSRYAVPTDVRTFVMVGICGGFTTFSSFSLQTFELARDGRVAQALGNIGLSVVFCLLAVTAGYYAAAAIPRVQASAGLPTDVARTSVAGRADMRDVAVAILSQPDQAEPLLDAATRYLAISGGCRLRALAIRVPPDSSIRPSEAVRTVERAAAIRAARRAWAGRLRAVVEAWQPRAERQGVQADLIDVEGDAAAVVIEQGRRADAIVVARPAAHENERAHDGMHAALFETGCPVLVVPPRFDGRLGRVVAIAWKDDERAAKSVRAALPILGKAEAVHVLCAAPDAAVPAILADHDIRATAHTVPEGEGTVGERILAAAHQLGADLLVMGAFSHAAWRERLLGGVTRTMLASADLPLLMRH